MGEVCAGLQGGLGNQLFQYASGRALAERLGASLTVHARARDPSGLRRIGLSELGLAPPVRRSSTGISRAWANFRRALGGAGVKTPAGWSGAVFEEEGIGYDPRFETLEGDVYLAGYFQSWRYFEPIAEALRAELRAGLPPPDGAPDLSGDSVSLHVRLGDYAASAAHAALGPEWYASAAAAIRERVAAPRFLLFSDEPERAAALLGMEEARPVDLGSRAGDLAAMSRCRHHIIANSTFSWWGAWAGPGGLTVAPRRWFGPEGPTVDLDDLLPPDWLRV